jgi:hypothetical protein
MRQAQFICSVRWSQTRRLNRISSEECLIITRIFPGSTTKCVGLLDKAGSSGFNVKVIVFVSPGLREDAVKVLLRLPLPSLLLSSPREYLSERKHIGREILLPINLDGDLRPTRCCGESFYTVGKSDAGLFDFCPCNRRIPRERLIHLNPLRRQRMGYPVSCAIAARTALMM